MDGVEIIKFYEFVVGKFIFVRENWGERKILVFWFYFLLIFVI